MLLAAALADVCTAYIIRFSPVAQVSFRRFGHVRGLAAERRAVRPGWRRWCGTEGAHARGVTLDRYGTEIPMEIKGAFSEGTAHDEIEASLGKAAALLATAMKGRNASVAQFRQSDLIELQNAVRTVKFARPHCVCRICQGHGRWSCTACHGTGFQTKAQYDQHVRVHQLPYRAFPVHVLEIPRRNRAAPGLAACRVVSPHRRHEQVAHLPDACAFARRPRNPAGRFPKTVRRVPRHLHRTVAPHCVGSPGRLQRIVPPPALPCKCPKVS